MHFNFNVILIIIISNLSININSSTSKYNIIVDFLLSTFQFYQCWILIRDVKLLHETMRIIYSYEKESYPLIA